jgi:hypothetical protein
MRVLKVLGTGAVGLLLAAMVLYGLTLINVNQDLLNRVDQLEAAADPSATSAPTLTATGTVTPALAAATTAPSATPALDAATTAPSATPALEAATTAPSANNIQIAGKVDISGVPEVATNVLNCASDATFSSQYEASTWLTHCEPGVLLVGPDFPKEEIDRANGAIQRINPSNQYVIQVDQGGKMNVPQGQFAEVSFGGGQIQITGPNGTQELFLAPAAGRVYKLTVRGLFPDETRDSDLNSTMSFSNVAGGHVLGENYPAGAFISAIHGLEQEAQVAHNGGTNCGDAGCTELIYVGLDLNTGAYSVAQHNAGTPYTGGGYVELGRNW